MCRPCPTAMLTVHKGAQGHVEHEQTGKRKKERKGREREGGREGEGLGEEKCVCVREREVERESVCLCLCLCERRRCLSRPHMCRHVQLSLVACKDSLNDGLAFLIGEKVFNLCRVEKRGKQRQGEGTKSTKKKNPNQKPPQQVTNQRQAGQEPLSSSCTRFRNRQGEP